MDPEKASELVKHGSTLLFLDVPQYTLIGIDTQEERYDQAVKHFEFDRHLGPYSLRDYGDWKHLSNYITKDVIEHIGLISFSHFTEPIGGEITVTSESNLVGNVPKTSMERTLAEQLKSSKLYEEVENSEKKGCYYTLIPRIIKQKGISGAELTSVNLDKTNVLESIILKEYDGVEDRLLGELQFAFIAFLMGQSLDGFLQWKALVGLLLGCTQAPFHTRSQLFTKFIKCVYHQLKYGFRRDRAGNSGNEESSLWLDDSWFSSDSFLHHLCKEFFLLVDEASVVDGDLLTWTRKLKELLENALGWEFRTKSAEDGLCFDEDDEYAPMVEMLDESNSMR